jgi:hypothetical protein
VGERLSDDATTEATEGAGRGAESVVPLAPIAAPEGALSSTWFCAAGTAADGGVADHSVVIANPADRAVQATVTVHLGSLDSDPNAAAVAAQPPVATTVTVPARASTSVRLADVAQAPFAAAVVEVEGGGAAVDHVLAGGSDIAAGPCASGASPSWYFATGTTTRDAREILVLFNPFPEDAVIDLAFATTEGYRSPNQYQGYVVPGGDVAAVDISPVVARHANVSAEIVARTGRLVVERVQTFDGSAGPAGMDVTLGAPRPAEAWYFPDGQIAEGITEVFTVFNPGDAPAETDLEVALADPATNGAVEPIELTVPPHGYVQVVMNQETRLPAGVAHSVTVRAANEVPVIAERYLGARAPAGRRGVSYAIGSPWSATTWVLAAGAASASFAEFLVLQNPANDRAATVRVFALAGGQRLPVEGLQDVVVEPAGRQAIDLGQHINREQLPLMVEATEPVVVERTLYRVGAPGIAASPGVPLFDAVASP